MNLFTSNSKYSFLIKVILVSITLSTLYWFSGRSVMPAEMRSQNQGQENKLKLESLLNVDLSNKTILVGSSLSSRIEQEYLGSNYFNFGLGGESALTGLKALRELQIKPKAIIVELNVIRTPNVNLLEQVVKLRYLGLLFSESHQPVTRLITLIKPKVTPDNPFIPELYKIGLEDQLKATCPASKVQSDQIAKLKEEINYFKRNHTAVHLLKVPVDPRIEDTLCSKQHWKLIREFFGDNIIEIETSDLQTSDGIHLTGSSAKIVAKSIINKLETNVYN